MRAEEFLSSGALPFVAEAAREGTRARPGFQSKGNRSVSWRFRVSLSSVVIEGDEAAALVLGVGHLAERRCRGPEGDSVFAAHRDTFFVLSNTSRTTSSVSPAPTAISNIGSWPRRSSRRPTLTCSPHLHVHADADHLLSVHLHRACAAAFHRHGGARVLTTIRTWKSASFRTPGARGWVSRRGVKPRGRCCPSTPVTVPCSKPAARSASWSTRRWSRRSRCIIEYEGDGRYKFVYYLQTRTGSQRRSSRSR